jgi:hypothetical protein
MLNSNPCISNGGLHDFFSLLGAIEIKCQFCNLRVSSRARFAYHQSLRDYVELNRLEFANICWHNYNDVYNSHGDVACGKCGHKTNSHSAEGYNLATRHIINILVGRGGIK